MHPNLKTIPDIHHSRRAQTPLDMDKWIRLVGKFLPKSGAATLLDLGCGTGRLTATLAEAFAMNVIGMEPSELLMHQALKQEKLPNLHFEYGRAEQIPLPSASVSCIFMSNVFHYIEDLKAAMAEMSRVLTDDGVVFVRNCSLENLHSLLYLSFFPRAFKDTVGTVRSRAFINNAFGKANFYHLGDGTIQQTSSPDVESYLSRVRRRVYSDLVRIPEHEFAQNLQQMESYLKSYRDRPIFEEVDYFVYRKVPAFSPKL